MNISHMWSINEIRDACRSAYQNYDQCTDIRHTEAARLLLYALITAQGWAQTYKDFLQPWDSKHALNPKIYTTKIFDPRNNALLELLASFHFGILSLIKRHDYVSETIVNLT